MSGDHPIDERETLRLGAIVALALIVVIGAAVRIHGVSDRGLSVDEITSLMFSTGRHTAEFDQPTDVLITPGQDMLGLAHARSMRDVWRSSSDDTHPPLHGVVLRWWRNAFGEGDRAARALSVLFGVLAIPTLFDVVRLLHGRTAALWAAAIFAVTSPQVEFSQQVRGYTMLALFALMTIDALVRIERFGANPRRAITLGLGALVSVMTHYNAIPICLALGVYAVIRLRGRDRTSAIGALAAAGAIFLAVWGATLWGQRNNFGPNLAWLADDRDGLVGRTIVRLAGLPLRLFILPMTRDRESAVGSIAAILYIVPLALLIFGKRRDLLLWCLVGGAIIATVAISDLVAARRTLEHLRFTYAATPVACAIAAAMTAHLKKPLLRHAVPATFLLGCVLALPTAYARADPPDLRGIAREFDREAGPNDVIVSTYVSKSDDWYNPAIVAAITHYAHSDRRPILVLSRPIDRAMRDQLSATPGVWFVHRDPESPPIDQFLPGAVVTRRVAAPFVGSMSKIEMGKESEPPMNADERR